MAIAATALRRLRHALLSVEVAAQRGAALYGEMLDHLSGSAASLSI